MSRPALWLVAYDITAPRRIAAAHRFLRRHGLATQYSVFIVEAGPAAVREIIGGLARRIQARTDDVRLYGIDRRAVQRLGRAALPEGLSYHPMPANIS